MNLNKCAPLAIRTLIWFAVISTTASIASAGWKEKVLYSFQGIPDGAQPAGGVVFDKAGKLYGATTGGGSSSCASFGDCGTVYKLMPPARKGDPWTEALLYIFKGNASNDGATPGGGLVNDSSGNLYGVTAYGGTGDCVLLGTKMGCGAVYEMTPPETEGGKWTETVLYSFRGGKDGDFPIGDLTFDNAGNLYGATQYGGGYGSCNAPYFRYCGTIFKLSRPKMKQGRWKESVLYSFKSGTDGANPNGGLVFDGNGVIYGTTYLGGYDCPHNSGQGCGTVFELRPPIKAVAATWAERLIYVFKGGSDGEHPLAGMIFGADGRLYGTTFSGGTVFSLTPQSKQSGRWKETTLYTFGGGNGDIDPQDSLLFDSKGDLWGTASYGGHTSGEVFELAPPRREGGGWTFHVVYGFPGPPDGAIPSASLIFDTRGNLYSTTTRGGTGTCSFGCGTVFEVSPLGY